MNTWVLTPVDSIPATKRALLSSLVLIGMLSLSACGGDSSSSSNDDESGASLSTNETAATIPGDKVGQYIFTFSESASGSGITDGTQKTFAIGADGSLIIDGTQTLSNPVLYKGNQYEAIWTDATNNLKYAASSIVAGETLREINISNNLHYDENGFTFYGQFNDPNANTNTPNPTATNSITFNAGTPLTFSNITCEEDANIKRLKMTGEESTYNVYVELYGSTDPASGATYVSKRYANYSDTTYHATITGYNPSYAYTPYYGSDSTETVYVYTNTNGNRRVVGTNIPLAAPTGGTLDIDLTCTPATTS